MKRERFDCGVKQVSGNKLYAITMMRRLEDNHGMFVKKLLGFEKLQFAEHIPAAHVMPIDYGIVVGEAGCVAIIQKQRAHFVFRAVGQMVEVKLIVTPLHHRIIY